ncbi:MAG: hypothetical protein GOMPHAMPRED_005055 [Gomphillus americanus]|uniref:Uncharacterized protein n=1 Tax=Gomphillus americanus TaxID=1940652 RepID=A0A8H3EL39_9LECA|nr:MAG: hypothetical protein GOMPHAMPRED_005055 [Gomphillus americanus]
MYFPSLILLATTALAAPLIQRDAASILQAITNIENHITTLNNTLNTFNGNLLTTIPTVLKIEEQTAELGDAISAATDAANLSPALSETDSGTVATAVVTLVPKIQSLLSNIIAHKNTFDRAVLGIGSVSPQVEQDLQTQSKLSDEFSGALIAKLAPDYAALAPLITNQISAAFQNAVKIFATSGGLFHLPAVQGLGEFEELLKNFLHLR